MDPRIQIRIHSKMSWIRNTGFREYKSWCFPRWRGAGRWRAAEGVVCHHQPGDIQPQLRPLQVQSRGQVPYSCCVCGYSCRQCCGSGMFIPDPDFYPSRIQKQQQERGVKKICCYTFLCSHKFHKIDNYFSFEMLKKQIWANFQRITGKGIFFYPKNCH